MHIHAEETASNNNTKLYFTLSSFTTSSVETLVVTSEISSNITSKVSLTIHGGLVTAFELNPDDRLLFKIYANVGSGSAAEITVYFEGETESHFTKPAPTSVFSDIFVRRNGRFPLTANWAVGGFNITNIGTVAASLLTVTATSTYATTTIGNNVSNRVALCL